MDRRLLKSNGRVAHVSLKGQVNAERYVEATPMRVACAVAPIYDSVSPGSWRRDRELVLHELFHVLETGDDWVFGYAGRDGYVGYMRQETLAQSDPISPTHVISARQSYLTSEPVLKNKDEMTPVSFGTELEVFKVHENGRWAETTELRPRPDGHKATWTVYVPVAHLRPLGSIENDPANVAERFLGTPYHWGGNSAFGIDCSGLVQAALLACGIPCPGDSDLQEAVFPDATGPYQRGDLLFWKGHVAMVVDAETLIHANAHHMAVTYENINAAIARIEKQGDGPVTSHKRPTEKDLP